MLWWGNHDAEAAQEREIKWLSFLTYTQLQAFFPYEASMQMVGENLSLGVDLLNSHQIITAV